MLCVVGGFVVCLFFVGCFSLGGCRLCWLICLGLVGWFLLVVLCSVVFVFRWFGGWYGRVWLFAVCLCVIIVLFYLCLCCRWCFVNLLFGCLCECFVWFAVWWFGLLYCFICCFVVFVACIVLELLVVVWMLIWWCLFYLDCLLLWLRLFRFGLGWWW